MTAVPEMDDPGEMLDACHARIRSLAGLFRKMIRHSREAGGEQQARQAAGHILHFFETAALYHQQDEEQDLYPLLIAAAPRMMRVEVEALVRQLLAGHQQIRAQWQKLKPRIEAIAHGEQVCLDNQLIERFMASYETVLKREESACFPLMAHLLDRGQLAALGMKMSERRGVQI